MFSPWHLVLCKAKHALKLGQLDEAGRLVSRTDVCSFRPVRELRGQVAGALFSRARSHLERGDSRLAWLDLLEGERLGGDGGAELRGELTQRGLAEALRWMDDGQPAEALAWLAALGDKGAGGAEFRRLESAAKAWVSGLDLARRGHPGAATEYFETALRLIAHCPPLEECLAQARLNGPRLATLEGQLLEALSGQDWAAAVARCESILAMAPLHSAADAARRRAWQAGGVDASAIHVHSRRPAKAPQAIGAVRSIQQQPSGGRARAFRLWVDTVGGFLVCLNHRVSLGQPGQRVDIGIMGELARLHAFIERHGETYLLRSTGPAQVNGQPVEQAILSDGDCVVLGQGVRLRFRRPSRSSNTARLEVHSPQRLAQGTDAVILMGDFCTLGPQPLSHVVAPAWDRQVTLYRQGDELWCRMPGEFDVDGRRCSNQARLGACSRIKAEGLSMALEPAGDFVHRYTQYSTPAS